MSPQSNNKLGIPSRGTNSSGSSTGTYSSGSSTGTYSSGSSGGTYSSGISRRTYSPIETEGITRNINQGLTGHYATYHTTYSYR